MRAMVRWNIYTNWISFGDYRAGVITFEIVAVLFLTWFQYNVCSFSASHFVLLYGGPTKPVVKRPWRSHSTASAPLPFAGLKINPQPPRGDPVNPSGTDHLNWCHMANSVDGWRRKETPIQKPTGYKAERLRVLWKKPWFWDTITQVTQN